MLLIELVFRHEIMIVVFYIKKTSVQEVKWNIFIEVPVYTSDLQF